MRRSRAVLLALFALLAATAYAAALNSEYSGLFMMGALPAPEEKAKSATPAKGDGDYVGSDTCIACHEDQNRRFKNTVMGKVFAHPRTPDEAHGCEACHGPGKGHVDAGGGKGTIPVRFTSDSTNTVAEKNAACLQCHSRGNRLFWKGSPHDSRHMACVDCHIGHAEVRQTLSEENRFNAPLTLNTGVKKPQP